MPEETLDADLWDILLEFLPQTWEGWTGAIILICAILAALLPKPGKNAHPAWITLHRVICTLGLGASKLKGRNILRRRAR